MNEPYQETITRNGVTYHYDPDYDCYYRKYSAAQLGHWDQWGWIYVAVLLSIVCYAVT